MDPLAEQMERDLRYIDVLIAEHNVMAHNVNQHEERSHDDTDTDIDTDTDTNTNTDTKTARASTEDKVLTARLTNAQKAMQFSAAYASGRCVHHPPHSLWEALAHHFLMRLARPVDG
jgi:hypothetical protein